KDYFKSILEVDVTEVPGIEESRVLSVLGVTGSDMSKWPTGDHFTSWLRLAPRPVKQDFFGKIFMMTTMAVLTFPIEEKIKQERQTSNRKHPYKVNRTNALSMVKEISTKIFKGKKIAEAMEAFDKILLSTPEVVRKGRKFPRKKIKKKPPSMNYKQL